MNLIPSKLIRSESNAEKKIFKLFSECKNHSKTYIFHSLSLAEHNYKREGEIDFLVVGTEGIFAIEVKGGRVSRRGDTWVFTNMRGNESYKRESPFDQARTAIYSLQRSVIDTLGEDYRHMAFGYGVAFPDIVFDIVSPEWSNDIVYDANYRGDIDNYLNNLMGYWKAKSNRSGPLTNKQVQKLVEYLRGEFSTVREISADINETENQLIKLTKQQATIIESIGDNPRVWIEGAAGTGKTLLAYEQIRKLQLSETGGLYICFNRLLASYIKTAYETEFKDKEKLVKICTVHNLFLSSIDQSSSALRNIPRDNKFYKQILPEMVKSNLDSIEKYEHVIIDEAQDIFINTYVEAIGAFIKGGWSTGSWSVFLDPENQKNLYELIESRVVDEIKGHAAKFKLTVNCRNTNEIDREARLVSGYRTTAVPQIDGMPVKRIWYNDDFDQATKLTRYINEELLDKGVTADEMVILSAKNDRDSLAGSGRLRLRNNLQSYTDHKWQEASGKIATSTISSFKGLEKPIVIITDIESLEGEWMSTINYVGHTRASSLLIVCARKDLRKLYQQRALDLLPSTEEGE